jgi:hypothetical protein
LPAYQLLWTYPALTLLLVVVVMAVVVAVALRLVQLLWTSPALLLLLWTYPALTLLVVVVVMAVVVAVVLRLVQLLWTYPALLLLLADPASPSTQRTRASFRTRAQASCPGYHLTSVAVLQLRSHALCQLAPRWLVSRQHPDHHFLHL